MGSDEPDAPAVEAFLEEADSGTVELCMSSMNVAETFYILAKRDSPAVAEEFLSRLPSLPIRVVLPNEGGIIAAAGIKAGYAVALGDALRRLGAGRASQCITGDHEIRQCAVLAQSGKIEQRRTPRRPVAGG